MSACYIANSGCFLSSYYISISRHYILEYIDYPSLPQTKLADWPESMVSKRIAKGETPHSDVQTSGIK